jgi:SecD/SecF fusion protein
MINYKCLSGKVYGVVQASKWDLLNQNRCILGCSRSDANCIFIFANSFRKWQYGLGARSIAHDVIFVLGIYSLFYKIMPFGMEIDQHFIAAIHLLGYSMNDTVIVFDRVREFLDGKIRVLS